MDKPLCAPWPNYSEKEAQLVRDVLLSNKVNYWTGDIGLQFENEFASAMDSDFAIALANGTVALELALHALDIGVGDEVVVTARSFMASASVVQVCGATPVFADVDPLSQNMTAETIEAALTPRTKAVICVHLAGYPCDMKPICELAEKKGLSVIEDCAQAHGAKYAGKSVGSWGDISAWSFCQDKIMTTGGEGGMVTTNSSELYEKMWSYKDHGKSRQKMQNPPCNRRFKYVHDSFGTNFRLTEMQCELGRYQLQQLGQWRAEREKNANSYDDVFSDIDLVRCSQPPGDVVHAYYKYYFFINIDMLASGWDRDRIVDEINDAGGQCGSGSCPEIYKEKAFVDKYGAHSCLTNAARLGNESLMLKCHPGISEEYLQYNGDIISRVLHSAMAA